MPFTHPGVECLWHLWSRSAITRGVLHAGGIEVGLTKQSCCCIGSATRPAAALALTTPVALSFYCQPSCPASSCMCALQVPKSSSASASVPTPHHPPSYLLTTAGTLRHPNSVPPLLRCLRASRPGSTSSSSTSATYCLLPCLTFVAARRPWCPRASTALCPRARLRSVPYAPLL